MNRALAPLAAVLLFSPSLLSYSVLTHEAIIDTAWDTGLKPLLLARFPNAAAEELKQAHANAYGGCILQDMGYYPFGNKFFSDLLHYVRTDEFIRNLIRDSQTIDEYAFALGSLAHYAADTQGHSIAVNRVVPMQYPKLRRKYGNVVTYAENPAAHMKVEFGFDVVQVTRGTYAPQSYHDFIGFKVQKDLLQRAFHDTYSLDVKDVFADLDLALGTYRRAVSSIIPWMTNVAWSMKKDELMKSHPGLTRSRFVYKLSRARYRKEWDGEYRAPGLGARILAFVIRIVPKVGPLKFLAFKPPTPADEKLFEASFNKTLEDYRRLLAQQSRGQLALREVDFDTGRPTRPGEYTLADDAYARLARKLARRDPASVDPAVKRDVLAFFRDPSLPYATKKDRDDWRETLAALETLRAGSVQAGSGQAERSR